MRVRRLVDRPIVIPHMDSRMGTNINGPSLVRVPEWVENPLGRYYLYFAHHSGTYIRLAHADELTGPWRTHEPGVLPLPETGFSQHVASPDVHVDSGHRRLIMYYHGCCVTGEDGQSRQPTRVALSRDGLAFRSVGLYIGRPYFRVFTHQGWHYAVLNRGWLYRSHDPVEGWEEGGRLNLPEETRHVAVWVRDRTLRVFYSVRGHAPERILASTVDLRSPWPRWTASDPMEVLAPERVWEGADLPNEPSSTGLAEGPVRQLRDPAVYQEDGEAYLLYSVAGERGIGIARIEWE